MNDIVVRLAEDRDRDAIFAVEEAAFDSTAEPRLVDALVKQSSVVVELVAEQNNEIVGHVLFSRLIVEGENGAVNAVALAPLAVLPVHQGEGIGSALVEEGHRRLQSTNEQLCIVLGDPAYYSRFGYSHDIAADFSSDFQCDALQAIVWGPDAPTTGRLIYALAFAEL